ncbi:MAG: hypothetical protein V9G10_13170 [Candidatus Nanopelagicales bacterium]
MVVAVYARMQRHHQAVVGGHPGLLEHEVPAQGVGLRLRDPPRLRCRIQPLHLRGRQSFHPGVPVRMIRRHRTVRFEEGPPRLHGGQPSRVRARVDVRDLSQPLHVRGPIRASRLEVAVGPEIGRYRPVPICQCPVESQVVSRVVCRRQELDAEPVVERPRPKLRRLQGSANGVVDRIGRVGSGLHVQPEDVGQLRFQPVLHSGSAKGRPVIAENPERRPGLIRAEFPANPEFAQTDALRVQQSGDVVIRGDQQARRIAEGRVVSKPLRRHMTVRRDDWQVLHLCVERAGNVAHARVRGQQPVRMHGHARIVPRPMSRRQAAHLMTRPGVRLN